jgi:phage shock protein PspC (stress-responsive transcriptional regulator)
MVKVPEAASRPLRVLLGESPDVSGPAAFHDSGMDAQTNAGTDPGSGTGPYPGPPQDIHRLFRRPDRGMVAGVAAGLGEYFDVDPVLFRIGFVLTTLLGGVGVVVYGLACWIIPPAPVVPGTVPGRRELRSERLRHRLQGSPAWVGVALVIIGFALLASQTRFWRGDIVWGVALIALGMLLFKQHRDAATAAGTAPPGAPSMEVAPAAASPSTAILPAPPATGTWSASVASPPQATAPPAAAAPPVGHVVRRRRERSSLGWLTVGAVLVVLGLTALLDAANAIHVSLGHYLDLAMAVLGIGILVGSWWGRARWLIVFGVLLLPFVLASSLIDVPLTGGAGQRFFHPQTIGQVRRVYHQAAGDLVIDLRDLPVAEQRVSIRATNVAGRILVYVPRGISIAVRAQTGAGELELLGERSDGLSLDATRRVLAPRGSGTVNLDLETSFGKVEVRR